MEKMFITTICNLLRQPKPFGIRQTVGGPAMFKVLCLSVLTVAFIVNLETTFSFAQSDKPTNISGTIPIEMNAPWWNREHTAIVDEVVLRGSLHFTARAWISGSGHVDRVALNANAVDIHGTSEMTGQRFRLNGAFFFDLRDPAGTYNSDGTFTVPMQEVTLFLHKVDPEPARLDSDLSGNMTWTIAVYSSPAPNPTPCQPIYRPDGTPTGGVTCGNNQIHYGLTPLVYDFSVKATGGPACAVSPCEVPDGSVLYNGYTGDYYLPLYMRVRTFPTIASGNISVQWHCRTGNQEMAITAVSGGEFFRCTPRYSATAPITVFAMVTDPDGVFLTEVRTYRMLPRPIDQAPVITSFSVKAWHDPEHVDEVPEGAILFNGQTGEYVPPLFLRLNASDPEADPVSVQWYCKTGITSAPIANLGNGVFSCSPLYSPTEPITVFAVVSDGTNSVTSEVRTYRMMGRIN